MQAAARPVAPNAKAMLMSWTTKTLAHDLIAYGASEVPSKGPTLLAVATEYVVACFVLMSIAPLPVIVANLGSTIERV